MEFVGPGIADDFLAQLPHLSFSPQAAIDLGIFENRNIGIASGSMECRAPAKDSVVAQRETKHAHPKIPQRIAHAINQFAARKAKAKATADNLRASQRLLDLSEGRRRRLQVGMKEPEHLPARDHRAGIHLRGAPARRDDDAFGEPLRDRRGAIRTPAVDHNDLQIWIQAPNPLQKLAKQACFIQNRNYDGKEWRSGFHRMRIIFEIRNSKFETMF